MLKKRRIISIFVDTASFEMIKLHDLFFEQEDFLLNGN